MAWYFNWQKVGLSLRKAWVQIPSRSPIWPLLLIGRSFGSQSKDVSPNLTGVTISPKAHTAIFLDIFKSSHDFEQGGSNPPKCAL